MHPTCIHTSLNDLRRTENRDRCITAVTAIARVSLSPASPSCSCSTVYSHSASGRQTAPFQQLLMLIGPERWKFALFLFSNITFCLSNACGWLNHGWSTCTLESYTHLLVTVNVKHHSCWGKICTSHSFIIMHVQGWKKYWQTVDK